MRVEQEHNENKQTNGTIELIDDYLMPKRCTLEYNSGGCNLP